MKKTFLLSAALLALASSATAQSELQIKLSGENVDSLVVNVFDVAANRPEHTDTLATKGGKVTYTMDYAEVRQVMISPLRPSKIQMIVLPVMPGVKAKVQGTWDEQKLSGDQTLTDAMQYRASSKASYDKYAEENDRINELKKQGVSQDSLNVLWRQASNNLRNEMKQKIRGFVSSHPDHDYSAFLAMDRWVGNDSLLTLLSPSVKEGPMKAFLDARKEADLKQREEAERRAKEQEDKIAALQGKPAPEISLPTFDGSTLTLSSLRGKVVVVDFWGKWCYWCMKGMPDMKKYYEKYQGKLEILGVNYGDTDEVWRKTTEEENLSWKHVKMEKSNQQILSDFGVSGFPTKVIVSKDGTVLKVVVGESPDFYTYLDELLGKE